LGQTEFVAAFPGLLDRGLKGLEKLGWDGPFGVQHFLKLVGHPRRFGCTCFRFGNWAGVFHSPLDNHLAGAAARSKK
jgi:hypothetical protein